MAAGQFADAYIFCKKRMVTVRKMGIAGKGWGGHDAVRRGCEKWRVNAEAVPKNAALLGVRVRGVSAKIP